MFEPTQLGRRESFVFFSMVAIVVMTMGQPYSGYQTCTPATCKNQAYNVAQPSLDLFLMSEEPCTQWDEAEQEDQDADESLTDYTSIAVGTNGSHGAAASVVGQYCQWRACSGPNCVNGLAENRNIQVINLAQKIPNVPQSYFPLKYQPIPPYTQIVDSNNAGTTNGPRVVSHPVEGEYTYRTSVTTTVTNCNIIPFTHPEQLRLVNAMDCKPEWVPWRLPLGNVTLDIPLSMSSAGTAAANAAAAINARNLGIYISVSINQGCLGPTCILLEETIPQDPVDPNLTLCGAMGALFDPVTGITNFPSLVKLQIPTPTRNWRNAHPQRLERILSHELMHLLGLDDREEPNCTKANTVMQSAIAPTPGADVCYDSAAPTVPPGTPFPTLGPSWSDTAATRNGAYGVRNQKVCGF